MREALTLLLAAGLMAPAAPTVAAMCGLDVVPAATLLLPHFAVDLGKLNKPGKAETTTLLVFNAREKNTIVRVTLWTDLSVPTLAFDLFLPKFEAQEIAVHELFRGNIPPDRVPPDINNALCGPDGLTDPKQLQAAHTGRPVAAYGGRCAGFAHGGKIARGYITIDNVNRCDDIFPHDSGYFGSVGAAKNDNQLTGQVRNDHGKFKTTEIEPLVHLEAGGGTGTYTFYGRYVGYDGSDRREPLAVVWAAFYDLVGSSTTFEVWRDSGAIQGPFQCNQVGKAGWYPMDENGIEPIDQEGFLGVFCSDLAKPEYCFPLESGAYEFGRGPLAGPFRKGWVFLNLNLPSAIHQSYVSVRQTHGSNKSRGRSQASAWESACARKPPGTVAPIP